MAITENQLISDLKSKKVKNIYLLTGEENYGIDTVSDFFEHQFIDQSFRDFDQSVLYGRDVSMETIISMARRFPMMSPYQLILVKEAQDIRKWDQLPLYLDNPQPQTVLVFCYRHKKMDKRSAAYKSIAKHGVVFEKDKLKDYKIPEWIMSYVRENGYDISPRGASIIAESIGNELSKIANELSKVFISLQKGSQITESIIEENIGISKDYNIFELQNAIGQKDVLKCNKIINHFAANPKENSIQAILPNLYAYFIKIMIFHQLDDKNKASSVLGIHPYYLQDYQMAATNYSLPKLASIIGYLKTADLKSKGIENTGTITDGELLKELIFKILH